VLLPLSAAALSVPVIHHLSQAGSHKVAERETAGQSGYWFVLEESFLHIDGQVGLSSSRGMAFLRGSLILSRRKAYRKEYLYPRYPVYPCTPSFSFRKVGNLPNPLHPSALRLLEKAASRAGRRGNVPFPLAFVRSSDETSKPPLARLVQGGRGGEVRLKLYLCITMMATAEPFDIRQPPTPQSWARMLALPPDTGDRRVNAALRWLNDNGYVQVTRRPGNTPAIRLLSVWEPGAQFVRASSQGRYLGVPIEFWTNGWILQLSATGIALLFALLESQGGYKEPRYLLRERRASYGLSHNTWTNARKELEAHRLLTVQRVPQGSFFDYKRLRNTYRVDEARLLDKP
jgi:hypothetical protein